MLARKIIAIGVLSLMVVSSVGLNVDFHLCQGKIKSIALFGEASKCIGMDEEAGCSQRPIEDGLSRKPCCADKQLCYNVSDFHFKDATKAFRVKYKSPCWVPVISEVLRSRSIIETTVQSNYRPPPDYLVPDIVVLNEAYLM